MRGDTQTITRSPAVAVAAAFMAALGARAPIVVIGPILPLITADLAISHAVGGLLITLPVLLMAIVAIPSSGLQQRFGTRLTMTVSLVLLTVGGIARSVAPSELLLLVLTVPIGVAIGVIGVVLPTFVKQELPAQPARGTGAYVTAMLIGASAASMLAVPLAEWGDSWRVALLVFGLLTVVPLVGWLATTRSHTEAPGDEKATRPPLPWHSRVAWLLVLAFCLQSIMFYGLVAWLAPTLVDAGTSPVAAGAVVGLFVIVGLPATIAVSWFGDRLRSRRAGLVASALLSLVGAAGFAALPGLALVWAVIAGLGSAAIFALVMTLPLDVAARPAEAGGYSALMLGAGYLIASAAPFMLGAVRDVTGSFNAPMWLIVICTALLLVVCAVASPSVLHADRERLGRLEPAHG